jgi:replicative DNA helicase
MQESKTTALIQIAAATLQARSVAGNAEQRLIGSLIAGQNPLSVHETSLIVQPGQFSGVVWQATYGAIVRLAMEGREFAPEYVAPLVAESCEMDVDQVVYEFIGAIESVSAGGLTLEYARSVVRLWQERELRTVAAQLITDVDSASLPTEDAIANLVRRAESIRDGMTEPESSEFTMAATLEAFQNQPDAEVIRTGIDLLDYGTRGGFRRGQFIVVGARPSVGKSALCGQIALSMASGGKPVMYLSFEMSPNEMTARWLNQGEVSLAHEMERDAFAALPLRAIGSAGWSIDRVESESRLAVHRHGMACLVVDYLGLIRPSDTRTNRVEQVSDMTRRLKQLAATLDIVVLSAHQFNRQKEGREVARPKMSDFRDSGSVEQDADILIGLDRDLTPGSSADATLYVMKQRSGETSDILLTFEGSRTRFKERIPGD